MCVFISQKSQSEKEPADPKARQSHVVFFSNLPRDHEKKSELLTVARRFGSVEKHLFLNGEVDPPPPLDYRMQFQVCSQPIMQ